jgi:hypothetical protein
MTIIKTPALQSKPTLSLMKVNNSLGELNSQVSQIRPPIDTLALDLTKLKNELLNPAIQLCLDISQFCEGLHAALEFCKLLRPTPFIGQLVSQLANAIEGLRIEQTVKDVVNDIRSALEKVRATGRPNGSMFKYKLIVDRLAMRPLARSPKRRIQYRTAYSRFPKNFPIGSRP